jgi:hypothetical protein
VESLEGPPPPGPAALPTETEAIEVALALYQRLIP